MWISKWEYRNLKASKIHVEDRLNFQIRLLSEELAKYRAREEAAPAGCMAGTQCSVCKHGYSTGDGVTETKKFHCKLVAAKLCDRFEEATP